MEIENMHDIIKTILVALGAYLSAKEFHIYREQNLFWRLWSGIMYLAIVIAWIVK